MAKLIIFSLFIGLISFYSFYYWKNTKNSENKNTSFKEMESNLEYQVLDESGHEGNFVKEHVLSSDSNYWCSQKTGLPAWISFDLLKEKDVKGIRLRNLDGCNTAPRDIVIYTALDPESWKEHSRVIRPKSPGSEWWEAPLNTNTRYVKLEFLNNNNFTENKSWSLYTYLYEVAFTN